jgi:hypothetical protein
MVKTAATFPGSNSAERDNRHRAGIFNNGSFLLASDFRICLLLISIPVVMSVANSSWLFTPVGLIDPWSNVGFFLHYADPTFGESSYKIARLSWIIPGFVVNHIFEPVVASFILHMGYLILSILFFYLTIARLFGSAVAFATAACFVVFIPFHGSGGWDYQNTAAGAYYIITFYLVTVSALSEDWRALLFWAGATYAAAVHATISFVNMAPILALHFLIVHRHQFGRFPSPLSILLAGFWFLSGAVILTVLLGVVNVAVDREFLYFKTLLEIVISRVHDSEGQARWWFPWSNGWFLEVHQLQYLSLCFAVLIASAVSVVVAMTRRDGGRFKPVALSLQIQYMFIGGLWIIWQTLGHTALQPDYFAYPIYPVMFFALAGIASTWQQAESADPPTMLFYGLVAIVVVTSLMFPQLGMMLLSLTKQHVELALMALALLVVGLFAVSAARPAVMIAAVLAFCVMNGLGVPFSAMNVLGAVATGNPYSLSASCNDRSGAYVGLVQSHDFLIRFVANSATMLVWWNPSEVLYDEEDCRMSVGAFAQSLASTGFEYLAPPWTGMPDVDELPANSITAVTARHKIAIPTADHKNIERIIERYGRSGVKLAVQGRTIIRTSRFAFYVYVLGVDNGTQPPELPRSGSQRRLLSGLTIGLPLKALQALNGGMLSAEADGAVVLTTPAQQYAYAASGALLLPARAEGPTVVRVRLKVEQGKLGVGVLARGNASQLLDEQAVQVTSAPVELYFDLSDAQKVGSVLFRSLSPSGVVVRVRIVSIDTVLEREVPPEVLQP